MDLFLVAVLCFMALNVVIVVAMLRRVDLNNASVQAWEQQQVQVQPQQQPVLTYQAAYLADAG